MTGARLAPFRALRYRRDRLSDLGAVLAPPYDVITPEGAAALREKNPYNIVRITNPTGGAGRYAEAAGRLNSWIDEGVLARDSQPSLYAHRHRFTVDGTTHARLGLWALLRLEPLDGGVVLPHERTMKGPRADRLALMRACGAQLSPIFVICSDPDGRITRAMQEQAAGQPLTGAEFPPGEAHEIWRVKSEASEALLSLFERGTFLIADGHHRYETALAYRDGLIEAGASNNGRNAHEFVLVHVVPEGDPGLLLLPTHRVVRGGVLDCERAIDEAGDRFEVTPVEMRRLEDAAAAVEAERGTPTFLIYVHGRPHGWRIRLGNADARHAVSAVTFHELFLGQGLGLSEDEQVERLSYSRDAREALSLARSGAADAAAILAPPGVRQVRELAAAGVRLPPKTTYFWPKVPTGVAIHRIDPDEQVDRGG